METKNIITAKVAALGIDTAANGQYASLPQLIVDDDSCYACGGGHLYSVEIPLCDIEAEEDFDSLDCGGYQNPSAWELPVVGHKESGYHFIKNAAAYVWQKIA